MIKILVILTLFVISIICSIKIVVLYKTTCNGIDTLINNLVTCFIKSKINWKDFQIKYSFYDLPTISRHYQSQLIPMRKYFTSSSKEAKKYRDDLFLIAITYHRVFPFDRFIMLDVDLKFKIDVAELYEQFSIFENENDETFAAVGRDLSPHYATGRD